MKIISSLILGLIINCIILPASYASIIIGGTRVIYSEKSNEVAISLTNNSKNNTFLVQSWIENKDHQARNKDFIITPPLIRMDAKDENILRIININPLLPKDRESLFWLNVKAVPSSNKTTENVLRIVIKSQLKVFYRPSDIESLADDAYKKLIFEYTNNGIKVTNPTPFFINLKQVNIGNQAVNSLEMLTPFESHSFNYGGIKSSVVSWSVVNDLGGESSIESATIR
ncbi:molecular chaperone [Moellerella wisconsensis]|uniref:Molecular chaperone n=2 Tax=Moellerella wisconsensis TaxID=158849 RepID=A0A9Q8PYH8_9GAMM|nr:molecular chaperone [Moellerella wisconsensis]UNH26143.1 molecular chaperone [Moellerella wisconsensis]UNH29558.1 molecular chaperone [Moellerella wisconsensis]UNH37698.1 molecular chaperone [Moellerella wisconsensis]WJW80745.1 molecular chaperone [Moellerella wisconsensis]